MADEIMELQDTNAAEGFEDLFEADEDAQDTNVQKSEAEPVTEQEPEPVEQPQEEPKYKVNFLGQERELPVSELVTAAQKGMNYDHIKQELENLKQTSAGMSDAYGMMERMARASGMSVEQYIDLCGKTLRDNEIKAQVDRGVPEEIAGRLLELEEKEKLREIQDKEREEKARERQAYTDLIREYPDLKLLPPEVMQSINAGETPLNAYRAFENKQLRNEIAVLKKTEENRNKSPGSMHGDAPEEVNDFLAGFDSE